MEPEIDTFETSGLSKELSVDHPLGRDEFLYDLIGINIIGLKSLGVLITNWTTIYLGQ